MTTMGGRAAVTVFHSGIVIWKVRQHLQQVRFERLVGAVELVDQEYRRNGMRLQRSQERAGDQELLGEQIRRDLLARLPATSPRRISSIWRA